MASQEKITVHNLADLKNTSDDAIPNYLNSLKFKQNFSRVDTRLALGYSAFAIAAACFAWDYKFGFENTKYYTAAAVAVYAVLNTILTVWIAFVEKGIVYEGVAPSGDKITIATATVKNVPVYHMTITMQSRAGQATKIELKRSFTEWFDEAGHFIAPPFQTMLASSVPVIATADPKRATSQAPATSDYTALDQDVLDSLTTEPASATASGADAASKKSKRRKA